MAIGGSQICQCKTPPEKSDGSQNAAIVPPTNPATPAATTALRNSKPQR